jgi:dolichol kinase
MGGTADDEVRRRTVHVASGVLGPLAAAAGSRVATPAFVALVVVAGVAELARRRWPWARAALQRLAGPLFRPGEATMVSGAAMLALGYAMAWWLFPVAAAERAILVAAVADPMAATVGSRFGGGRRKSWAGSAACAAAAALVLLLTGLPGGTVAIGAVVAAVAERAPWRGADNLLVPVGVGATLWWMA